MRKKLVDLITNNGPHGEFELALQRGIVLHNIEAKERKLSKYYTPSSLVCSRQMFYRRTGVTPEEDTAEYNAVDMADTGTRRHEGIQEVLVWMAEKGGEWEYVDVEEYVNEKNLHHLDVLEKHGAETHLRDEQRGLSFMVDGILKKRSTGEYFLFEFKNVISFKFDKVAKTKKILPDHVNQVTIYCAELGLNKAFVVYENRDNCKLCVPETLSLTRSDKEIVLSLINTTEEYVKSNTVPPAYSGILNPCKYCRYVRTCNREGKDNG